jgi:ribosome-associated translation inhibitor RaiA
MEVITILKEALKVMTDYLTALEVRVYKLESRLTKVEEKIGIKDHDMEISEEISADISQRVKTALSESKVGGDK